MAFCSENTVCQNFVDLEYSQERRIINKLRRYELDSLDFFLTSTRINKEIKEVLRWKYESLLYGNQKDFPIKIDRKRKSNFHSAIINLYYGDYLENKGAEKYLSLEYYKAAEGFAVLNNDMLLACEALKRIISQINRREKDNNFSDSLHKYERFLFDDFERNLFHFYKTRTLSLIESKPYIQEFKEGLRIAQEKNFKVLIAFYYKLLGVKYEYYADVIEGGQNIDENYKTSLNYYDRALTIYRSYSYEFAKKQRAGILLNKGINFHVQTKYDSAYYYYSLAEDIIPQTDNYHLLLLNLWSARTYEQELKYDYAYWCRQNESDLRKKDAKEKTDINFAEIDRKHFVEENKRLLLKEQQKVSANRNWLIAISVALLLGMGIAVLLQKNTTKKRQLAEQEVLLKQQRVENLLKEQELVSIDAMIAGQEKERQRVANELHDDLGSLMATIQLHFDHAKVSKKDPALKNAQKLLEQAYQKVRGIAHHKNSGVMSNQGLLPAIQKMARTISETNALQVSVEDFGMGERMENSLELTIFRMVQELVANAIKHAEATHVDIHLTQHEENLNIIVADNGKGFEHAQRNENDTGMGLTNVEKRIEHLEGSFTIDSILGKGTSILIDIPV